MGILAGSWGLGPQWEPTEGQHPQSDSQHAVQVLLPLGLGDVICKMGYVIRSQGGVRGLL